MHTGPLVRKSRVSVGDQVTSVATPAGVVIYSSYPRSAMPAATTDGMTASIAQW